LTTEANPTVESNPLAPFSAPVREWFKGSFEGPTPAQTGGWKAISGGDNALICAPTGSGKTLAAFLWGIDRLTRREDTGPGVRIVYISPLKALSYDIERNLRVPLEGIGADIAVGLRTGDTSQAERRAMRRDPPDILITTPESLYLMLSSGAREILTTVEAVIVDEIHAVAQSKRGAHLALTLERLEHLAGESPLLLRRVLPRLPSPANRAVRNATPVGADSKILGWAETGLPDS
jgi:ATP-dependent Lhr-like helicase